MSFSSRGRARTARVPNAAAGPRSVGAPNGDGEARRVHDALRAVAGGCVSHPEHTLERLRQEERRDQPVDRGVVVGQDDRARVGQVAVDLRRAATTAGIGR
jgi:hypothetical protein